MRGFAVSAMAEALEREEHEWREDVVVVEAVHIGRRCPGHLVHLMWTHLRGHTSDALLQDPESPPAEQELLASCAHPLHAPEVDGWLPKFARSLRRRDEDHDGSIAVRRAVGGADG